MAREGPLVYWDTCIFIAWLAKESRTDIRKVDLQDWTEAFRDGNARLITSQITYLELLQNRLPDGARSEWTKFMRPPLAQLLPITPPVLEAAYQVREHFAGLPPLKEQKRKGETQHPTLSTPDAIHIATAVLNGADYFHTTDGGHPKKWGLLDIRDLKFIGGGRLRIERPESPRDPTLWDHLDDDPSLAATGGEPEENADGVVEVDKAIGGEEARPDHSSAAGRPDSGRSAPTLHAGGPEEGEEGNEGPGTRKKDPSKD